MTITERATKTSKSLFGVGVGVVTCLAFSIAEGSALIVRVAADSGAPDEVFAGGTRFALLSRSPNDRCFIYGASPFPAGTYTVSVDSTLVGNLAVAFTVAEVTGLASSSFDVQAAAWAPAAPADTGATVDLAQANEVLVAAMMTLGPAGDAAGTWGAGYTPGARTGTTGSTPTSNVTLDTASLAVSSTEPARATNSGFTDREWAACVASFKLPATVVTGDPDPLPREYTEVSLNDIEYTEVSP